MNSLISFHKRLPWWLSGVSLFMIAQSLQMGQLYFGILSDKGWSGMWVMWCGGLVSFVVPLVFAPLWQKLQLQTDNQFYLIRYPGFWGKFLHVFRIGYVGILVSAFLVSFNLLAFSRIVAFFFAIPFNVALFGSWLLMLMYALFNLNEKRKKVNVIMLSFVMACVVIMIWKLLQVWPATRNSNLIWRDLFPGDQSGWMLFWTYIGVQWWSALMFDGGGKETARFVANATRLETIKAAMIPVIGHAIVANVVLLLCWFLLQSNPQQNQNEWTFIPLLMQEMPMIFQWLILIGFGAMFLSVCASQIQWGGSLVMIDGLETYKSQKFNAKILHRIEWLVVLALSLLSWFFAFYANSLMQLTQIVFSISAGVAPFYIGRWFWWRISAFSQWMVMMISALITLFYSKLIIFFPIFHLKFLPMEESRLIVVTLISLFLGVMITLLFPSSHPHLDFIQSLGSRKKLASQLLLAIVLGVIFLMVQLAFLIGLV